VNLPEKDGYSPFLVSCQGGHHDVVSLLLADDRVRVNQAKDNGCTPFYIACEKGHKEVVLVLLADVRIDLTLNRTDNGASGGLASLPG